MATIQTPETLCDRPGCGKRVTARGAQQVTLDADHGPVMHTTPRLVLPNGPDVPINDAEIAANTLPLDGDEDATREVVVVPPDLCRECRASLETWWTSTDRRRQTKGDST